jgi:hypothetical protein
VSDLYNPHAAGAREVIYFALRGRSANRSTGAAANQAATVAQAADTDRGHTVSEVLWSYSGTPTGAGLTLQSGSDTLVDLDIAASGPGSIVFNPPLVCGQSEAVTLTLKAGGSGVTGKVQMICWRM